MCVCTEKRTVANREVSSNIHYEMGKCCNSTALVESFLMCRFKRHVQLFFLDFILDFVEIFLKECNLCFCCVWFIYFFYVWMRYNTTCMQTLRSCCNLSFTASVPRVRVNSRGSKIPVITLAGLWLGLAGKRLGDWCNWLTIMSLRHTQNRHTSETIGCAGQEIKNKAQTRSIKHVTLINTIQIWLVGFSNICASPQYVQ